MARKHSDTKQFLLGVAVILAAWAVGIFASGILPLIVDYVDVSEGYPTLSFLYPFMLIIYSAVFSAVCKRESKDAMFFGFYLFLAVPTAVYLLLVLYSYLGFEFLDYIPLIWGLLCCLLLRQCLLPKALWVRFIRMYGLKVLQKLILYFAQRFLLQRCYRR